MARRIEGGLLGWTDTFIFDDHIILVCGIHITRLDREKEADTEAPPYEVSHTVTVELAQDSQLHTGLPVSQAHKGRRYHPKRPSRAAHGSFFPLFLVAARGVFRADITRGWARRRNNFDLIHQRRPPC
jgi:hypothetical protein